MGGLNAILVRSPDGHTATRDGRVQGAEETVRGVRRPDFSGRGRDAEGASGTSRSRPDSVLSCDGSRIRGRSPSSSSERWTVVAPKRPRKWSPIKWEETKKRYGYLATKAPKQKHSLKDTASISCSRREFAPTKAPKHTPSLKDTTSTSCSRRESVPTKALKFKNCPVHWCKSNFYYRKGHTFGYHYPTGLAMEEGQDTRTEARVQALIYLARALVGQNANVDYLVQYLNNSGHLRGRINNEFDRWTTDVVAGAAGVLGLAVPENLTCSPLNSPGCVFHYRVMLQVVILLGEKGQYDFLHRFGLPEKSEELEVRCPRPTLAEASPVRDLRIERGEDGREVSVVIGQLEGESCSTSAVTSPECAVDVEDDASSLEQEVHSLRDSSASPRRSWQPVPSPEPHFSDMEVVDEVGKEEVAEDKGDGRKVQREKGAPNLQCVDSHFHLDRLCDKVQITPWNFKKAMQTVKPGLSHQQVEVDGAVAVWCDPETYSTRQQVASLLKEKVVSVIGIHPSRVQGDNVVRRLREKLDTCDVVGLGEIGVDGTKRYLPLQRRVFEEALGLLESRPHLVLVLHCRPRRGESSTGLYFEMFYRCKAALRPEQKIHLHCFNGSKEDVDLWLGYFPNTHFGYSLMLKRADFRADSRSALQRIDSSRLLLETDATYFKHDDTEEWSSPAFIALTAQEVARVRRCRKDELLRVTAENAQRLYRL